ncbi:MAG: Spy/CpxP family protein refolding chaperone [Arcobacter sp.]|uniref:Spy/CpxP family protein refolding chaperone n=1 Tax=Arcobacter sp. TaxID=1872629 RepID=UPI003AFFFEB9
MKRILVTVVLLSSLVSTFLFAVDMKKGHLCKPKKENSYCHMKDKKNTHFSIMRYIHNLNLSDEQVSKVKAIMKDTKPKIQSYSDAFINGKFDKNRYIDISLNKYKNMVEYKATLIDKIYDILTIEQKNELKKMLDSNSFEGKRGMKHDKHSNGGR